eukprot:1158237-Pelagomonas_calceolata.AAC.4
MHANKERFPEAPSKRCICCPRGKKANENACIKVPAYGKERQQSPVTEVPVPHLRPPRKCIHKGPS